MSAPRELTVGAWPSRPADALLPAVPLRMRVRGRNAAGDGEWSEVLESRTDVAGFCGVRPQGATPNQRSAAHMTGAD